MSRAQITIFFMIGLVLVITLLILLYAVQDDGRAAEAAPDMTDGARQYLASCLDNAVYEHLDSLRTRDFPALKPPSAEKPDDIGLDEPLAEAFPPISEAYDDTTKSTLFGTVTMPATCDEDGPNADTDNSRCATYGSDSIQENLTRQAKQALSDCTARDVADDFETPISGYPEPAVTVILGRQAFTVNAGYPAGTITRTYDVRLLSLLDLIHERLRVTTKDPRIEIDDEAHASLSNRYKPGFAITKEAAPQGWRYTFTDENSRYRGNTLAVSIVTPDRPAYIDTHDEDEEYDPDN